MKIQLASEDIAYFEKNGRIEFQGLVTEQDLSILGRAIDEEIQKRASLQEKDETFRMGSHNRVTSFGKKEMNPGLVMQHGRDVSLSTVKIRDIVHSRKFAETASQLLHKKPLRWGFDQVIDQEMFMQNIGKDFDLEKSLSVSGLLIACAIFLDTDENIDSNESKGRVLFFKPRKIESDRIEEIESFFKPSDKTSDSAFTPVFLFGYTDARPMYLMNPKDPHTHYLKNYGYGFGDRLKETTHPILYR